MKLLILYEELAGYIISCVNHLVKQNGVEVYIIRKQVNAQAPFEFNEPILATLYDRKDYTEIEIINLIEGIHADIILCCGWGFKPYLKVCKKLHPKTPILLGFDNPWQNSLKQNLASIYFKIVLKKYFSACFVPGIKQKKFGLKLGFNSSDIFTGIYSCDTDLFGALHKKYLPKKQENFPHKFIFVGRYIESKGILDLWTAFEKLQIEMPNNWELWCLGAGEIEPIKHPKIFHFGFVQPNKMEEFIANTGVFVLPSHSEPWGVVVHEFTSAGFPIICSDKVGASEVFVSENSNGYIFESSNIDDLVKYLKKIVATSDADLFEMGEKSFLNSKKISLESWCKTILEMEQKFS